jgi:putative DNA primase/helicase
MAFGAVARVVLCAAKVKGADGDDDRRLLVRSKSNIGPDDGGFEYGIAQSELAAWPGVIASAITWGAAVDGSARELLAEAETEDSENGDSQSDADAFLRSVLEAGAVPAKGIKGDADGAGFSWRTVQRAAQRMGVERRKEGMKGGWVWALPPDQPPRRRHEGAEDANFRNVAPSASSVAPSGDEEAF